MRNNLADILASCLESIERGERTLEECLALYPEHRADLEALLGAVTVIREGAGFAPRPSFRLSSRERLLRRLPARQVVESMPRRGQRVQPVFAKRAAFLWAAVLVLAVALVGGGTVYASAEALPGDFLFPVKRSVEDARLWLSGDAGDVVLGAQLVQVRVDEIQALAAAGRGQDLELAVDMLSQGISASTQALGAVAREDPERAAQLSILLEESLSVHSEVLNSRLDTLPEQARPAIQHAINASNRGRETVQELFGDERPGSGPPHEIPAIDPDPPAGGPPDELPGPAATRQPGGGPPEEIPGTRPTRPGGGPPEGAPGAGTQHPGGGPPEDKGGPPTGVPGRRP